ncbi:hypothetical protein MARPO_0008s0268 [Marchantia polymorpha]|uniref:Uncharacterized protein n=1 Tax=Marchantia polymorpha TaxID=3197 RepID=A0A2R6XN53_MARPO|nr:hypothetical protein MARPO_0008s0268 [Marchantia polymorpha]|eukprot:PTQ47527.1 hypothetical protein MARPO_0008s0268 [Marchantia polymorpha]
MNGSAFPHGSGFSQKLDIVGVTRGDSKFNVLRMAVPGKRNAPWVWGLASNHERSFRLFKCLPMDGGRSCNSSTSRR